MANTVEWLSEDDPDNPWNWSYRVKVYHTYIPTVVGFLVYACTPNSVPPSLGIANIVEKYLRFDRPHSGPTTNRDEFPSIGNRFAFSVHLFHIGACLWALGVGSGEREIWPSANLPHQLARFRHLHFRIRVIPIIFCTVYLPIPIWCRWWFGPGCWVRIIGRHLGSGPTSRGSLRL